MEEDSRLELNSDVSFPYPADKTAYAHSLQLTQKFSVPSNFPQFSPLNYFLSKEKTKYMNSALRMPSSKSAGPSHILDESFSLMDQMSWKSVYRSSMEKFTSNMSREERGEVMNSGDNIEVEQDFDIQASNLREKNTEKQNSTPPEERRKSWILSSGKSEDLQVEKAEDYSVRHPGPSCSWRPNLDVSAQMKASGLSEGQTSAQENESTSDNEQSTMYEESQGTLNPLDFSVNADKQMSSVQEEDRQDDKHNRNPRQQVKLETLMKLRECHLCRKHFVSYEDPMKESLRKHSVCDHCILQCSSLREDVHTHTEKITFSRENPDHQNFPLNTKTDADKKPSGKDVSGIQKSLQQGKSNAYSEKEAYDKAVSNFQDFTSKYLETYSQDMLHSKPFTCDICFKRFTLNGSLTRHKRLHSGRKPYECDVCERSFSEKGDLMKHKRIHSGDRPYECDVCGKSFTQSSGLIVHKRMHFDERPYKCDVCGKGFAATGQLTIHRRKHSGDRPYKCEVCAKSFASNSRLNLHKNTHLANRPFSCDVCGKGFACNSNLNVHKRIHSGEKLYKCEVCERGFARSDSLAVHMRMHTGERPYKCELCEETFVQSYGLKVHKKRAHQIV